MANEYDVVEIYDKLWGHITADPFASELLELSDLEEEDEEEEVILDAIIVKKTSDTSSPDEGEESLDDDEATAEESQEETEQETETEEKVEDPADSQEDDDDDEPYETDASKGKGKQKELERSPNPIVWTEDNAFDPPFPRGAPWVPNPVPLCGMNICSDFKLRLEKYRFSVFRVTDKYAISRLDPDEVTERAQEAEQSSSQRARRIQEADQSPPQRARRARSSWVIDSDDEDDEPAMGGQRSQTIEEPQELYSSTQTRDTVEFDEDEPADQEGKSIEEQEMSSFRDERTSKPVSHGVSIAELTPTYADDEPRAVIFAKQGHI